MESNVFQILDFSIAIFTAILGIAYPLLIENINKVDDKYLSAKITERIRENNVVKRFHFIVTICILETVVFPLTVFFIDDKCPIASISIIVVHVLTTFAMMIGMLTIFRLINLFNNAQELSIVLSEEKRQHANLDNLDALFDISLYLLYKVKNEAQFVTVRSHIDEIIKESFNANPEKQPREVLSVIRRIVSESANSDPNNLYAAQNNLTPLIYNTFQKQTISKLQYYICWYGMIRIIKADNFHWFQQHWTFVSQYGDFLGTFKATTQKEKDIYVFEQVMLGTALLYYEKFDWLNHIFYFSNSFPPKYNAVPSDLCSIWHYTKMLEEKFDSPFELERDYNFYDEDFGARTENVIVGKALEYLALLIVRVITIKNYWYFDNFSIPNEQINVKSKSLTFKGYVEALRIKLNNFSDRRLRKVFHGNKLPQNWKEKVNSYLNSMSEGFELSEEAKNNNQHSAINKIIELLKDRESELNINEIPKAKVPTQQNDLLFTKVELNDCLKDSGDSISEMVVSSILNQLKRQKYFHYLRSFLSKKPVANYLIRLIDINEAINRLGITDVGTYFFVFTGNFDRNNLPIKNNSLYIPTSTTAILICKNTDKPTMSDNVSDTIEEGYDNIGNNLLYSNDNNTLSVGTYAGIEKPDAYQYVRINVSMSVYTDKFDLDNLPNISELLTSQHK